MSHYNLKGNLPFYTVQNKFMAKNNFKFENEEINHFTVFKVSCAPRGHTLSACKHKGSEAAFSTYNKDLGHSSFPFIVKDFAFSLLVRKANARNKVPQMTCKDKER